MGIIQGLTIGERELYGMNELNWIESNTINNWVLTDFKVWCVLIIYISYISLFLVTCFCAVFLWERNIWCAGYVPHCRIRLFDTHQSKLYIDLFKTQTSDVQTITFIVRWTNNLMKYLFGLTPTPTLTHTILYITWIMTVSQWLKMRINTSECTIKSWTDAFT